MPRIIAYSYEAAHHCPECTFKRFPEADVDNDTAEDSEGNRVHPLFDYDEWFQIDELCETLSCDDCHEEIDVAHQDPHSEDCSAWTPEEWSPAESEAALAEGWDLFDCNSPGHEPWELCRVDDPDSLPETWYRYGVELGYQGARFHGDPPVWQYVLDRAAEGSHLHERALVLLAYEAPGEFFHIAMYLAGMTEGCTCAACTSTRIVDGRNRIGAAFGERLPL